MPFTTEQFLEVFADYHRAWPYARWLLLLMGLAAIAASFSGKAKISHLPSWVLAVMWFWAGAAYHLQSFTAINDAAYVFGFLFILEGILLIVLGRTVSFEFRADLRGISGSMLILYSVIVYPVLGMAVGHTYPRAPSFGLPCPLVIFSLGMLLWTRPPIRWVVLVIPSIWVVIGTTGAFFFGIWEDLGLAGAFLIVLLVRYFSRSGDFTEPRL